MVEKVTLDYSKLNRVLICGDREWKDDRLISEFILRLPVYVTIIQGGARGADVLARDIGSNEGHPTMEFLADWERYGRAAGPIRNSKMLKISNPDLVVAFHDDIGQSKGTKHMISVAKAKGVPVLLITHRGETLL